MDERTIEGIIGVACHFIFRAQEKQIDSSSSPDEGLHRSIYAWPEPNVPISEVTFLWQGG